jgi:predicted alpha-1,6-mannanase (GH76 family)
MLFKCRLTEQFPGRDHRRDADSLTYQTCVNNNETTWTYNQGVILTGLALLYNATKNATLINIAQKIADAVIQRLTYSNGILKEPCEPTCDGDQKLFKGIFVRHLSHLLHYVTDTVQIEKYTSFLQQNAMSLLSANPCELDGLFGLVWNNESSTLFICLALIIFREELLYDSL